MDPTLLVQDSPHNAGVLSRQLLIRIDIHQGYKFWWFETKRVRPQGRSLRRYLPSELCTSHDNPLGSLSYTIATSAEGYRIVPYSTREVRRYFGERRYIYEPRGR